MIVRLGTMGDITKMKPWDHKFDFSVSHFSVFKLPTFLNLCSDDHLDLNTKNSSSWLLALLLVAKENLLLFNYKFIAYQIEKYFEVATKNNLAISSRLQESKHLVC